MALHLPYGGSSAHRTIGCPGWLKKSENLPPKPPGDAAVEGSLHHEVMERCYRDEVTPEQCVGIVYKEPGTDITREYTEDDVDLSNIAYNATNALMDDLDIDEFDLEPFVELVPGVAGGSIDLLGLSEDRTVLLIGDYKFGSVKVGVDESPNLGLYGIAARKDPKTADLFKQVKKIVFAIIQPRVKGTIITWETDVKWLDTYQKQFETAMTRDTISPGLHCKYCPAEPYCEAKRTQVMAANLLGAREQDELNAAAAIVNEVEAWCKSIKEEMYLQMCRGVPVAGWKVVEKRPSTKWTDEDGARAFLKDKRIAAKSITNPAALKTPIQIGKILKKQGKDLDLAEFTITASSGTTIATEDDPKEAVIVSDVQGELSEMMK